MAASFDTVNHDWLIRFVEHRIGDRRIVRLIQKWLKNARTMLTKRESQIMELVSEGLSNKEIGRRLNLSEGTIKVHLHHIYQKLAVNNRTALAVSTVFRRAKMHSD